jgi:hypothetical protein
LGVNAGAGSKETVGDGLGVKVGERLFSQTGDEIFLKRLIEPINGAMSL